MADPTQQFDPAVVALMHGIKTQEGAISGGKTNYNLQGKSGETGAYQWLPDTWKKDAQQYIGDASAEMTPENQNKVAYNKLKALKDQGKNPQEILSLWNSGRTNPTGNSGVNSQGQSFDTPSYVNGAYAAAKKYAEANKKTGGVISPTSTPLQKPSFGQVMANSAKELASDEGKIFTGIGKSAAELAQGAGQVILKGTDALGITKNQGTDTFSQDPNALKAKGGFETFGKVIGDVAPYLTGAGETEGAGFLAKTAGKFAENMAVGTAQSGSVKKGVETGILGEVTEGVGKAVSKTGEALYKAIIPTSKEESVLLQKYKDLAPFWERVTGKTNTKAPITSADTAFSKGLWGTETGLGIRASRASRNIWKNLVKPQIEGFTGKVNMGNFFDDAEKEIIKDNPELTRQGGLLEALESFKEDYKNVKDVSLNDLQKFKEGWAKFIPEKSYQGKPIAGMANDVKDVLAGMARTKIYNALGKDVKQAYIDYGNLQAIKELGQKAMTGGKLKGGTGSFVSGVKDMALTPILTVGGNVLYKAGQGIQFFGPAGMKAVGDLFK